MQKVLNRLAVWMHQNNFLDPAVNSVLYTAPSLHKLPPGLLRSLSVKDPSYHAKAL